MEDPYAVSTSDTPILEAVSYTHLDVYKRQTLILARGEMDGWHRLDDFYGFSPEYPRPVGEEAIHNEDPMLLSFTSGTTGMPKMVQHDFTYPCLLYTSRCV